MSRSSRFAAFWWDFLVGDDWRLTFGVLLALGSTLLLRHSGLPVWWVVPVAVAALLVASVRRATRGR